MKEKLTKEIALQYIYDYGVDKAVELLKITRIELEKVINDIPEEDWNKPSLNKNAKVEYLNPVISDFVENNYNRLHAEYVKNLTTDIFYQNDEDVFHNALIKVCSDLSNPSEKMILKLFDKTFKTIKWENNKRNNQMRKKEKNMKYDNQDGESEE